MSWWWTTGSKRAIGKAALVTRGLYGSWKLLEGSGTLTSSEAGLGTLLTLGSDSGTTYPTWTATGLEFDGTPKHLSRPHESAQENVSGGISLTVAYTLNTPTILGRLFLWNSANAGYFLQTNPSGKWLQVGVGNGTANNTQGLRNYLVTETGVICVSISPTGIISSNFKGTELAQKMATNLVANATAKLLIGYNLKGTIHYAAIHNTELTLQERANQVAYATQVAESKGVVI